MTGQQILDSSKLNEFADDNFKFDQNGRNLSKRVENTMGTGEIACYEQFLLFPQCFQKACFPGASNGVIVWELVKHHSVYLTFSTLFQIKSDSLCTHSCFSEVSRTSTRHRKCCHNVQIFMSHFFFLFISFGFLRR